MGQGDLRRGGAAARDAGLAKIDRKMLGPTKGFCIKLSRDEEVTNRLNLSEGIETGLSAVQRYDARPMWAAVSADLMKAVPVLEGIEALVVFADNDANQKGKEATPAADVGRAGSLEHSAALAHHGDGLACHARSNLRACLRQTGDGS
jgi:Toprim domain